MAEPRTPQTPPSSSATARELKLALVAALAGIYLALWPQLMRPREPIAAGLPEPAAPIEPRIAASPAASPQLVWLDTLPARERPPFTLPDGWRLAGPARAAVAARQLETTTTSVAVPVRSRPRRAAVRVAVTRRDRIRTRSS